MKIINYLEKRTKNAHFFQNPELLRENVLKKCTDVKITFRPKCACSMIKNLFLNQTDYL